MNFGQVFELLCNEKLLHLRLSFNQLCFVLERLKVAEPKGVFLYLLDVQSLHAALIRAVKLELIKYVLLCPFENVCLAQRSDDQHVVVLAVLTSLGNRQPSQRILLFVVRCRGKLLERAMQTR